MTARVLITGGAGFIGSHLTKRLVAEGHQVTVFDCLLPQVHGEFPQLDSYLLQEVNSISRVVVGSVESRAELTDVIPGHDVVVHLAAETGTGQSMYEIRRYVDTNIGGTATLLEVLANTSHSVKKIVVASSRAIYGEGKYLSPDLGVVYPRQRAEADMSAGRFEVTYPGTDGPLQLQRTDETSLLHPTSVYGLTKQSQEALVLTMAPALGIAPVALRYQNVFGPGQSLRNPYTGILSIFAGVIREGGRINVFEDGLESRDFVYIDDVIEATYRAITTDGADGLAVNVGSGMGTSVLEVVEALREVFDADTSIDVTGDFRLGDIRHNVADLRRARETLQFVPKVDFLTGLRQFVTWAQTQPQPVGQYARSLEELRAKSLLK